MRKLRWKGVWILCAALCILGATAGIFFYVRQSVLTMEMTTGQGEEERVLIFYPGEFGEGFSPLCRTNSQGEEHILSLCFSKLLDRDREGRRRNRSVASPWQEGERAAAHISGSYEPDSDTTTVAISLNPEAKTASGSPLTAEDVIFNYYLRCDASNAWSSPFGENRIVGQQEYLYGAKDLKKRRGEVAKLLKKPPEELGRQLTAEIVKPALEQELLWVKGLYGNKNYAFITDKYKEAKDLFAYYYAYQTKYQSKGKTEQRVFEDILKQYGWHYERLSRVTNEKYQERAVRMALCYLLRQKGKDEVKKIAGINKRDNHTVEIQIYGDASHIDELCDIWLLPLSQYGSRKLYDGREAFGFRKGETREVIEKSCRFYSGTGSYHTTAIEKERILLSANSYGGGVDVVIRKLEATKEFKGPEEIVQALLDKKLHFAWAEDNGKLRRLLERQEGASYSIGSLPIEDSRQEACILFQTYTVNATTLPEGLTRYHTIFGELAGVRLNPERE